MNPIPWIDSYYPSLSLHVEGSEDISCKPRPHAEYTRSIYPYIDDSVSYLNLRDPFKKGLSQYIVMYYYIPPTWRLLICMSSVLHRELIWFWGDIILKIVLFWFLVYLDLQHTKEKGRTLSEINHIMILVGFCKIKERVCKNRHIYYWVFNSEKICMEI